MLNDFIVRHKSTFSDFMYKKFIQNFCPNVVLKLFNKCTSKIFSRYSSEIFSEWSSEIAPKVAKLMRKFSPS
jgi:hypothetical protein